MIRQLIGRMSPGGCVGRLTVLIFHRVLPRPDPLFPDEVDCERFDSICGWLRDWFQVLPLVRAARSLRDGTLPDRALSITFDDGYADNHDLALPVLERHGLTATFFVATDFLDGGRMWNDTLIEALRRTSHTTLDLRDVGGFDMGVHRLDSIAARRAAIEHVIGLTKRLVPRERASVVEKVAVRAGASLPNDLMMRSDQVRALRRAGMQIGAHTASHPILATLDASSAREEIVRGRLALEAILQETVDVFAYPNGVPDQDYTRESVALVQELGFEAAVSTAWGASGPGTSPFEIPRFTPWDRGRTRFGLRLAYTLWKSRHGTRRATCAPDGRRWPDSSLN